VGNRLFLNRGGAVTSYTYDNMNRIASATGEWVRPTFWPSNLTF
jgi:hypothetical protein